MKCLCYYTASVAVASVIALFFFAPTTDGRSLLAQQPSIVLERWTRQSQSLIWQCTHTVDGCWITFICRTNLNLDLNSLVCHLDGREFDCDSERNLSPPASLSFKSEANLASVNNGEYHRMVISVRGVRGNHRFTLPWHFRFRVDPYYCRSLEGASTPETILPTTSFPVTTLALTTEAFSTAAPEVTTMAPVTTGQTTMPSTTQQPTTQRPTTQQPTTQRPTTQQPTTQRPTTQPPTTLPTRRPTTQRPTSRPTTPPTARPPSVLQRPPLAVCNTGRNSAGDLVISCSSEQTISSIAYEVNGVLIGTVDGHLVSISDDMFSDGQNSIELTVNYNNGQSYVVVLSYEVERQLVPVNSRERPCVLNCTGRFTFVDGLTVTCTVDNDPTGEGITSIVYSVNSQGFQLADGIPTFVIGLQQFQSGLNRVALTVSHSVCGRASLTLQFHLPQVPPAVCPVSCTYRVVEDDLEFNCRVDNGGAFLSVAYSINRFPIYNATINTVDGTITFKVPLSRFIEGFRNTLRLIFTVLCHNQIQQAERSLPIALPPPSSFQVEVISCEPPPETINPSFPVNLDISADTDRDEVVIQATGSIQRVLLLQWSLNGLPYHYLVASNFRLPKMSFRQGRNTLLMIIFGLRISRIQTTCILDIQM